MKRLHCFDGAAIAATKRQNDHWQNYFQVIQPKHCSACQNLRGNDGFSEQY
jgi:hypothetical protein